MLLANYASDSESETDESGPGPSRLVQPPTAPKPATAPQPAAAAAAPTAPHPAAGAAGSAAKGKKRGPVRITLDLPKVTADDLDEGKERSTPSRGDSGDEEDRGSKKPKLGGAGLKGGKGSYVLSPLFGSMHSQQDNNIWTASGCPGCGMRRMPR